MSSRCKSATFLCSDSPCLEVEGLGVEEFGRDAVTRVGNNFIVLLALESGRLAACRDLDFCCL